MKSISTVAIMTVGLLTTMAEAKPKNKPIVITPTVQTSNLNSNGLWSYGGCYQYEWKLQSSFLKIFFNWLFFFLHK